MHVHHCQHARLPSHRPRRELKSALERFWAGKINGQSLLAEAVGLRAASWARQLSLGVTHIPSNDFSLYDHVLDTSVMVGAIPSLRLKRVFGVTTFEPG